MRIGTDRFSAIVSPECSGLEGAALLLIFGVLWLILFRQDTRFPQSLLLLPAAVLVLFLLNSVRIAAFIVIGHAGARDVAAKGFHSQAGWIAFNLVAFGFSAAARRLSWFSKSAPELAAAGEATYNPAAAYLVPFLVILAARMISRAVSGNFEWFYACGFFAALAALWLLRRRYADLSWRFGGTAAAGGLLVFILWIALDRFTGARQTGMPAPLAAASPLPRVTWIALRALAATFTVPIAEELAFRGFLLRRLVDAHFEAVPFRTWTWFALLASSLAFGAMHGDRWLAGTVAGAVYAAAVIRTGRLGEAMAAHAITNALLAAYVLLYGQWQFW
jgi:exosortase E/protease (VPEID-CTERM system)